MEEIEFEVKGIAPLLMDKYHGLPDPKTPEGYKKQAEEKCYRNEKGELVLEAKAVKACMRLASSELGKKMEGKKNRQSIRSGIFFKEQMLPLHRNGADTLIEPDALLSATTHPPICGTPSYAEVPIIEHDGIKEDLVTRGNGEKVTRVITYRPMIKDWSVKGSMYIMGVPKEFIKQALELGGVRYGLLGYRPEYGRFVVTKFEGVKK